MSYCLVCESEQVFDDSWDEDCYRCHNCGSLPYAEVTDTVLHHREEYRKRMEAK